MRRRTSFWPLASTFFLALAVSYTLCIAADLLFGWAMYRVWAPLLPGFTWPVTAGSFLIGWLWLLGYSVYGTALLFLPYNYLIQGKVAVE